MPFSQWALGSQNRRRSSPSSVWRDPHVRGSSTGAMASGPEFVAGSCRSLPPRWLVSLTQSAARESLDGQRERIRRILVDGGLLAVVLTRATGRAHAAKRSPSRPELVKGVAVVRFRNRARLQGGQVVSRLFRNHQCFRQHDLLDLPFDTIVVCELPSSHQRDSCRTRKLWPRSLAPTTRLIVSLWPRSSHRGPGYKSDRGPALTLQHASARFFEEQ